MECLSVGGLVRFCTPGPGPSRVAVAWVRACCRRTPWCPLAPGPAGGSHPSSLTLSASPSWSPNSCCLCRHTSLFSVRREGAAWPQMFLPFDAETSASFKASGRCLPAPVRATTPCQGNRLCQLCGGSGSGSRTGASRDGRIPVTVGGPRALLLQHTVRAAGELGTSTNPQKGGVLWRGGERT